MFHLPTEFSNRDQLIAHVKTLAPWAEGAASPYIGGQQAATQRLQNIDPVAYGKTRNFGNGRVSLLSPYVHHGVLSLNHVRNFALSRLENPQDGVKFIQELGWRDFWQRVAAHIPHGLWEDLEPYKTGFDRDTYADTLPADILQASTGVACIDHFITTLLDTGYVHNHARMYLASYIVHFRHVTWQAGARWFLCHLLDGDEASNNLSWQWITSTFSNKPYIFNLENVAKYFGGLVDTTPENNRPLDASYENLTKRLFPNLVGEDD